jgi:outer membrane protein assembly factor BamB
VSLLAAALSLSACGGGDGDGGSGGSDDARLTVSPSQVNISADAAVSSFPTATVTITLHNGSPDGESIAIRYTRNAITGVEFTTAGVRGTLTISFLDPVGISLGTYSDSVQVALCDDSDCAQIDEGSIVTIPVTYTVTGSASVSLSAYPEKTGPGMPTTLTWSSMNAESCTASGAWSGTLPHSGSQVVTPDSLGKHVYTLSCSDPGRVAEASVTVQALAPVTTLSAFPANVVLGKTMTLRWKGEYASSCEASGDWSGALPAQGSRTLSLSELRVFDFHLNCTNAAVSDDAIASVTVAAAPVAAPATTYRMSESHDGVLITSNGITYPAGSAPAWTRNFGAPVSYPLIADGMVFITTAKPSGGYGNKLYALDAATGATVWGPISIAGVYYGSGLTYENGRVFVLMFDGVLRAFDAANGALQWRTQLPGNWYSASPNAYGGLVFVTGNEGLSALDADSGAILWTNEASATTGWPSPAVSSEGAYLQTRPCHAAAYDPVAGEALWETDHDCGHSWDLTPVIKNGIFFGRTWGKLSLFDAATGSLLHQLDSLLPPAVTDTAVIALNESTLSSTRLSDFVQTWTFTRAELRTAPVVVNGTVFVGAESGKVYGLDVETGARVWTGQSPVPIQYDSETGGPMPPSGPAAGEDMLVFPAGNSLAAWRMQ